jgi:nucleotide-binding universal stress UspA family protein
MPAGSTQKGLKMDLSLLLPLDGSACSEQALPTAASLAQAFNATLYLAHVHAPSALDPVYVEGLPVIDQELHSRVREHEQAYLSRISEQALAEQPGLRTETALLEPDAGGRDQAIAAALSEFAEQTACAYIVMTTHGRGGISRFWLGSVASALIHSTTTPLLLLPPRVGTAAAKPLAARRILLPLDGSPLAESIIPHAIRLGRTEHARFTLLRVVEPLVLMAPTAFVPPTDLAPERTSEQVVQAEEYLDRIAERLRDEGAQVVTQVVVSERPAEAILEAAERSVADLIALSTHGRSGLSRLLAGSVADKVLRGPRPILISRPAAGSR